MNHKRIIIVGRGASGKDHMRKLLERKGYSYAKSYTTRPPRPDEVNGRDYKFITEDKAQTMISTGLFYEWVRFNEWIYGTTVEQIQGEDLFIMTPRGLSQLKPDDRADSLVIFLDIPEAVRRQRMLDREMPGDSVERRLSADYTDFFKFTDYDIRITNSDF